MADSLFVLWTEVVAQNLGPRMARFSSHGSPPNSSSGNRNLPFVALAAVAAAGFVYTGFKYARRSSPSPAVAALARKVAEQANAAGPTWADRWEKGLVIGRGSFGVVYEGVDTLSGMKVAIKEMKDVSYTDDVEKEFKLLEGLRNPFVVTMYALEPDGRLILELCTGSLLNKCPIVEPRLRCYARQLLLGLSFLHRNNILHRDIKPANVLVSAHGLLKLADFGLSRHLDSMRTRTGIAGTPAYMSPEALEGRYDRGTDLWALGATLCHLATGRTPNRPPEIPTTLCPQGQDFLRKVLSHNVEARGTCDELLSHPFITNGGPTITESNCLRFLDNSTGEISLLSPLAPDDHVLSCHIATLQGGDRNLTSSSSPAVEMRRLVEASLIADVVPVGSSFSRPLTATVGTRQSSYAVFLPPPTEAARQDDGEAYSVATVTASHSGGVLDSTHEGAASNVLASSSAPMTELPPARASDDSLPPKRC